MVNEERFIPKRINNVETSLIRTRINSNLLKVKNESSEVKSLLSLAVQTSKPENFKHDPQSFNQICYDMYTHTSRTDRKKLLRTCILLATSRNTIAQENLIEVISKHIGKIKDKDYLFIANLISLKDAREVELVNDFLGYYLDGYTELHNKYCSKYYPF